MKTKKTVLAVTGLFAALSAAPAQAADDVTLRLDWVLGGYHAVWHYAKEKGVFARNGININLREGRGSMTTSQTVGNQSDEFGTADGGAMMVLRSKGLKTKMVAGYLRTGPSALIFPKSKGWKTWKDVKGAKIADSAGGSTIFLFKAVEKAVGISGNKPRRCTDYFCHTVLATACTPGRSACNILLVLTAISSFAAASPPRWPVALRQIMATRIETHGKEEYIEPSGKIHK